MHNKEPSWECYQRHKLKRSLPQVLALLELHWTEGKCRLEKECLLFPHYLHLSFGLHQILEDFSFRLISI